MLMDASNDELTPVPRPNDDSITVHEVPHVPHVGLRHALAVHHVVDDRWLESVLSVPVVRIEDLPRDAVESFRRTTGFDLG